MLNKYKNAKIETKNRNGYEIDTKLQTRKLVVKQFHCNKTGPFILHVYSRNHLCVVFFFEQKKITLNKSKIDRDQKFRHMAKPTEKKTIAHCEQVKWREETKGARDRDGKHYFAHT